MAAHAIEVKQLTRYFGKRRGIEDVSFNVHEDEIFGLLGPNGAGRTVIIRNLPGYLKGTRGNRQKLLIVWARMRDTPVLVLDEPGSDLDPRSPDVVPSA